ncbi:hypothetical protein [Saccharothrix australiensis]|uniref:AbiTii domain-containing protein n=1 Tax=Saccharothrix australiensis TaxID=2072 RepID=A0A495VT56_9PSEU|nr:hypothetical protein [Saccharothrix australiensis]RKT51877.1 hypothetical protein C8E97_0367 [Saccharothrix australiensis]
MRIDIEKHAYGLLEHLASSEEAETSTYLREHSLGGKDGHLLVDYLVGRGWALDQSTFGGADCDLTAAGLSEAQRLQTERMSPARRLGVLRTRMLQWLEDQVRVTDWTGFLSGDQARYHGNDFSEAELRREAGYLHEHGLIKAFSTWQSGDGMLRPSLTAEGRDCLIHFEGDVNQYLNRSVRPGITNNTTITMTDSIGNITNASAHVVQNANAGLDTTKVLEFAGALRQSLPILGLDEDVQQVANAQAEELHQEAQSATPDRGKMRRLLDGLLQALSTGSATAVQNLLAGLGDQALTAIGG